MSNGTRNGITPFLFFISACIFFGAVTASAQTGQSITLKPGFNFISFTTAILSTPQQLKTQYPAVADIYSFSPAAGSFLSLGEGTLQTLGAGKGYIIKNGGASDIAVTINASALAILGDIKLKTGFNLVGFSKVPSAMTFTQLMALSESFRGIYKWSAAAGSFITVVRDPAGALQQPDGFNPAIKAGESYFINVDKDSTINLDQAAITVNGGGMLTATITSFAQLLDITASNGTQISALGLPANVMANMSDDTTKSVSVTWDGGTPAFDGTKAGNYIFAGTISGTTLKAQIKVVVSAAAGGAIVSLQPVADKTFENGTTSLTGIGLPATVKATLSDNSVKDVSVTWDGGTPAYDMWKNGNYVFAGTVEGTLLKPQIKVIVKTPATFVSYLTIPDIVLDATSSVALSLPAKVVVNMNDGSTREVAVIWETPVPAFDRAKVGTFVYPGYTSLSNDRIYQRVIIKSTTTLLIYKLEDLYAVRGGVDGYTSDWTLDKNYMLMADLDFKSAASYANTTYMTIWTTGVGWDPIGAKDNPFTGTFDGNGHTISNLFITGKSSYRGLFGASSGTIKNLGIISPSISVSNTERIGGLAGSNNGAVVNCYVKGPGAVKGETYTNHVGGLVGYNDLGGTIFDSYASVDTNGGTGVGGLVGTHASRVNPSIVRCNASGTANCTNQQVGGLIGYVDWYTTGCVSDSFATTNITAIGDNGSLTAAHDAGGFVGRVEGNRGLMIINNCYATGSLVSTYGGRVGGFVGNNICIITNCYAMGDVLAGDDIGGFAGRNQQKITGCHSTGKVTGKGGYGWGGVGGFVGWTRESTITNCYSTGNASSELSATGGFVGMNGTGDSQCYTSGCYSTGSATSDKVEAGGFAGISTNVRTTDCYSTGDATGVKSVGGFIGYNAPGSVICDIKNVYSLGNATCTGTDLEIGVGGLIGRSDGGTISKCYALGAMVFQNNDAANYYYGRLVGRIDSAKSFLADNYANEAMVYRPKSLTDTTTFPGLPVSASLTSRRGANITISDAKTSAKYMANGWDFSGTWKISEGTEYPQLKWRK